jgi:hypothetical protein
MIEIANHPRFVRRRGEVSPQFDPGGIWDQLSATWYAIKLGPSTFGIFDTFPDDAGRQAHLEGRVAAALMAQAPQQLASAPSIEKVEILAAKLPG